MVTLAHLEETVERFEAAAKRQREEVAAARARLQELEEALDGAKKLLKAAPVVLGFAQPQPPTNGSAPTMREAIEDAARRRIGTFTVNDLLDDVIAAHPELFDRGQKNSLSSMVSKMAKAGGNLVTTKPGGPNDPATYEWRD